MAWAVKVSLPVVLLRSRFVVVVRVKCLSVAAINCTVAFTMLNVVFPSVILISSETCSLVDCVTSFEEGTHFTTFVFTLTWAVLLVSSRPRVVNFSSHTEDVKLSCFAAFFVTVANAEFWVAHVSVVKSAG